MAEHDDRMRAMLNQLNDLYRTAILANAPHSMPAYGRPIGLIPVCGCPIVIPTHFPHTYECAACGQQVFKAFSLVTESQLREWWIKRIRVSLPDEAMDEDEDEDDDDVPQPIFKFLHVLWHCGGLSKYGDVDIVELFKTAREPALVDKLLTLLYCTHAPKKCDVEALVQRIWRM
jgi:hypothetical protein